ncbi:AAA family ATPase [Methylorubrum extorquens]
MRSGQTSHWLTNNQPEWTFQNGTLYFDRLDDHYCSLAVELSFYEKLSEIGDEFARLSLIALQDAAYNPSIWSRFESDSCFEASLLRNKSYAIEMRDKVRSMFQEDSKLIETFSYEVQLPGASNAHTIQFDFLKTKALPNRLNIIAGTNGSGKTQLLARLAIELTGITSEEGGIAELEKRQTAGRVTPTPSFYSVIAISFNPFDQFERPTESPKSLFKYAYCGIRKPDNSIYSQDELVTLLRQLVEGAEEWQRNLLRRAARNVLGEAEFLRFFTDERTERYAALSAGQKIVLNTLAYLVTYLKPRALVLLDEPETHLHPSLMAALLTELTTILAEMDSYAIVATHSPIIAQQVPSRYINVIRRNEDGIIDISSPDIECFGESLSDITNALFDTREYERDYTHLIDKLIDQYNGDVSMIESQFPDGLGSNARVYLRSKARARS